MVPQNRSRIFYMNLHRMCKGSVGPQLARNLPGVAPNTLKAISFIDMPNKYKLFGNILMFELFKHLLTCLTICQRLFTYSIIGPDAYAPFGPGPGPLWDTFGPGPGHLWALARPLMGPGQGPYGLQQKSLPRTKLFGTGAIVP